MTLFTEKIKMKSYCFVPRTMESNVGTCYDDIGYVGIDKVVGNIVKTYWFPNIRKKVKKYIQNCLRCIKFLSPNGRAKGFLYSIPKEKYLLLRFILIISNHLKHVLTAVNTPRAQVERFNRVLIPILAKLSETPIKWDLG